MQITDETIEYVGILAKLDLSGEEKEQFSGEEEERYSDDTDESTYDALEGNGLAEEPIGR
jgi:hypothetical protein